MLADKIFQYRYSQVDLHQPIEFCLKALKNSIHLDLGLGYFSSASFNVLAVGMAQFIANGGNMNLYINKYISKEDYDLLKGDKIEADFDAELVTKFTELRKAFEIRDEHFFKCLSYLIQSKRINVKIIVLSNGGLPHEKYGIFTDEHGNKIYFNGSMNLTASAIVGNLETVECTCSWLGPESLDRVKNYEKHFNKIWSNTCEGISLYDAKKFCTEILTSYPDQDPELLLKQEKEFIEILKREQKFMRSDHEPHFPKKYPGSLPYQEEAYQSWIKNYKQGIFAMATGTGKTVTALNCALHEYESDREYQLLILVPTLDLVEQWKDELKSFNFSRIIEVSSLNTSWRKQVLEISQRVKRGRNIDFAIVSTYDSFVIKDFQLLLPSFSDSLILIADEAHNIGGKQVKECFKNMTVKRRIALSATPERIYDDEGTAEICSFFNDRRPYVYSYPMSQAIRDKRLCDYFYYPRVAYLNESEMELYTIITRRLLALWDSSKKVFKDKKESEKLLMNRKRIIHKCNDKLRVYREIIEEIGYDRLKYTFVYVPQGKYDIIGVSDEVSLTESDDISFIQKMLDETKSIFPNLRCNTFTSRCDKTTRRILLKSFEEGTIDILLAMKCLDEGVNIPRAEIGIFTSSTGNPREFIQRRGRLLRKHDAKKYSYIYDIIVIPDTISRDASFSLMESNLVRNELQRAAYFSELALNNRSNGGAYQVLNGIASHFGIIWSELLTNINQ